MTVSYKKLWKLLIDKDMKKKDLCAKNSDGSYSYYPAAYATREQACKVLSLI